MSLSISTLIAFKTAAIAWTKPLTNTMAMNTKMNSKASTSLFVLIFARPLVAFVGLILLLNTACTYQYTANVTSDSLEKAYLKEKFTVERTSEWLVHTNTSIALAPAAHIDSKSMPRNVSVLNEKLDFTFRQRFPSYQYISSQDLADEKQAFATLVEHGLRANETPSELELLMSAAKNKKAELLFVPSLVLVEDKLNSRRELVEGQELHPEKDYGLDRVVFQILIYDAYSGKILDTAIVTSRSRFFSSDKAVPKDLYRKAALSYLFNITGKKAK